MGGVTLQGKRPNVPWMDSDSTGGPAKAKKHTKKKRIKMWDKLTKWKSNLITKKFSKEMQLRQQRRKRIVARKISNNLQSSLKDK